MDIAIQTLKEQICIDEASVRKSTKEMLEINELFFKEVIPNTPTNVDNVRVKMGITNYGRAIAFLSYIVKLHDAHKISTDYLKLEVRRLAHDIQSNEINMGCDAPKNLLVALGLASISTGLYALYGVSALKMTFLWTGLYVLYIGMF